MDKLTKKQIEREKQLNKDKIYWLQTSKDCDTKSLGDILTRYRWKLRARCSCGVRRLCFMHLCFGEVYHKDLLKLNSTENAIPPLKSAGILANFI